MLANQNTYYLHRYHIINSLRPSELVVKSALVSVDESTCNNVSMESGVEKKTKFRIKLNSGKKSKKEHIRQDSELSRGQSISKRTVISILDFFKCH